MLSLVKRLVKPYLVRAAHRRNERLRRELETAGRALGPQHWDAVVDDHGDLTLGGCRLQDLADRFGTPLHVVHEERLAANFRHFRDSFLARYPRVEVGFSYKTNPLPGALRILHRVGAIAEVISHFELWLALQLGVAPQNIVFNGPGKTVESLRLAVERGVRIINLDNADEADTIQRFAREYGRQQAVGVRVITSVGWAAQFGLPLHNGAALAAFQRIRQLDHLMPRGLHIHLGTGIKDVQVYARAVEELFDFAKLLKETHSIAIDFFDLGGGFGVPTVASYSPMDERLLNAGYPSRPIDIEDTPPLTVYASAIGELADRYFPGGTDSRPTLFFEPGRAVSSSAQLLLLRVLAIKPGPFGASNVILDGGHNLAIPTSYEYRHLLPIRNLQKSFTQKYNFFGPLCHPGDVLARACQLPPLQVGDVLAMMDAGAYFIPNQMNFSHTRPGAVIVCQGEVRLTRRAETFEHVVALDEGLSNGPVSHG